VSSTA